MTLALISIVCGLVLLLWSADRFVEGSASAADHFGMPPLLIGIVVVGFGTSAPELAVSALGALQGSPGIALGNAYGSNITNIALILGITSLISPISVQSGVLRQELPMLAAATAMAAWQLLDGHLSRLDAIALLCLFALLLGWSIWRGLRRTPDHLAVEIEQELPAHRKPLGPSILWIVIGLGLLVLSSRLLVWGAVDVAQRFGLSDMVIGLTVVAVGTSLPELASSIIAARRNEHDIAFGNIVGSNLFNTLAVVGLAGSIHPLDTDPETLSRDMPIMGFLTLLLFAVGWGFGKRPGRVNRIEGSFLLLCFVGYTAYLIASVF